MGHSGSIAGVPTGVLRYAPGAVTEPRYEDFRFGRRPKVLASPGLRGSREYDRQVARTVDVTVTTWIDAPPAVSFDVIVPIDLETIFKRWLLLPGVRGVRDQSGPWDAAGRTRIVELGDGTEVPEQLTRVEPRRSFAYRVGPFPRPLGLLATAAEGEWLFSPERAGTSVRWTYRFFPRPGFRLVIRTCVAPMWRGYARRALTRAAAAAERANRS
ncbi:MAG: hypothetical protein QOH29_1270 [Actinomycetota bacterium]|nr:hypothetical protein [Actinomycetota bacterium]